VKLLHTEINKNPGKENELKKEPATKTNPVNRKEAIYTKTVPVGIKPDLVSINKRTTCKRGFHNANTFLRIT